MYTCSVNAIVTECKDSEQLFSASIITKYSKQRELHITLPDSSPFVWCLIGILFNSTNSMLVENVLTQLSVPTFRGRDDWICVNQFE